MVRDFDKQNNSIKNLGIFIAKWKEEEEEKCALVDTYPTECLRAQEILCCSQNRVFGFVVSGWFSLLRLL